MDKETEQIIINFKRLQKDILVKIKAKNITVKSVYNTMKMSRTTFWRKSKNSSFTVDEIYKIYEIIS
jgi:hypothetical protein